jgi:hypothetical protein
MPRLPAAASALAALLVYAVAAVAGGAVTREHLRLLIDATSFRSRS